MLSTLAMPLWAQILVDDPVRTRSKERPLTRTSKSPTTSCLVLLAHGSKDPRWREPFQQALLEALRHSQNVRLAFMEFAGPTLLDVAEETSRAGVSHWRVLPLFMAAGAHLATDIPEQVLQVQSRYPHLQIEVLPPIGEDPRLERLIRQIILEHIQQL